MENKDDDTSLPCKRCRETMTEDEVKNAKKAEYCCDHGFESSQKTLDAGEFQYHGPGIPCSDSEECFLPDDEEEEALLLELENIQSPSMIPSATDPLMKPEQPDNIPENLRNKQIPLMKPEPDNIPDNFRNKIMGELRGQDIKLVIQKTLKKSDVDKTKNRFAIPFRQIRSEDFLTDQEIENLKIKDKKDPVAAIEVSLIDPGLDTKVLKLKRWDMERSSTYALIKPAWKKVVSDNGLQKGDEVQLWSYRVEGKLALAMVKLK